MGLLDIFKKKKSDVQITWEVTTSTNKEYDPWAKSNASTNDKYAIAAFIGISEHGAKIGRTNDDYARYFNYRYGINDPIRYHKRVISDGYLVEASPEVALGKLQVGQLKSILSNAGLSDKGKKADLVSRIIDNIGIESLNLDRYYIPSEKGMEHLRKYEYSFRLSSYNISFDEFDEQKKMYAAEAKPNDIMWQILSSRFNEYNISGSYSQARNELLCMAKLLEHEERYVDALYRYILVLYYDVSGCCGGDTMVAPGIVERIQKLKDNYDGQIVGRCYDRHRLPHHYISKENFERLLFDIFENETIDIKNYTQ